MELNLFTTLPFEFVVRNRPPGGTTYLYSWTQDENKDDWRADGYRWRQGGLKAKENVIRKYFSVYIAPKQWSTKFTRIVYFHPDYPKAVVLKYIGDERIAGQFMPKNAPKSVSDSVQTQLALVPKNNFTRTRHLTHQDLNSPGTSYCPSFPQNQEQVENARRVNPNQLRLTKILLYNVHKFAYDTKFVRRVTTFPDLAILLYSDDAIQVFRETLQNSDVPLALSYDTTFKFGDFHLSILLFHETEFVTRPSIPLVFMIHERKPVETHKIFWQHIKSVCPEMLCSNQVFIVADQEQSVIEAIHRCFPEMAHSVNWNNILQDCKQWLCSHGFYSADEMRFYTETVHSLLLSKTQADYKDVLISLMPKWNKPFSEYFLKNIHNVLGKLGSWVLEDHELKGMTGNQSKASDWIIKQLQEWKEAPLDSMILNLYTFSQFSVIEVYRSRKCFGAYELKPELKNFYKDHDYQTLSPEIRNGLQCELGSSDIYQKAKRAQQIIDRRQLSLDANLAVFTVSESQESRVQLFPTTSCSCPDTGKCYHILAAERAIGLLESKERTGINSKLKKRTRNRSKKTENVRRSRPTDKDIELTNHTNEEVMVRFVNTISQVPKHRQQQKMSTSNITSLSVNTVGTENLFISDDICLIEYLVR